MHVLMISRLVLCSTLLAQLDRGRQPPARARRDRQRHQSERPCLPADLGYGNVLIETVDAGNR
jgi:hypothetical protein